LPCVVDSSRSSDRRLLARWSEVFVAARYVPFQWHVPARLSHPRIADLRPIQRHAPLLDRHIHSRNSHILYRVPHSQSWWRCIAYLSGSECTCSAYPKLIFGNLDKFEVASKPLLYLAMSLLTYA